MGNSVIQWAGKTYTGMDLTDQEKELLFKQVYNYLSWGNSFLYNMFKLNEEAVLAAAMVAKFKLDAPFGGLMASDGQVGIQLIRPGHILRTTGTTETATNDWSFTFATDADYWIGYGTNNTTAINIDKSELVLMMGAQFTQGNSPAVEELLIQVDETTYPVIVMRHAWAADNRNGVRATRFHPIFAEPKSTVLGQTYSLYAASQELVLLGLTFGLGRYLRNQTYSTISL